MNFRFPAEWSEGDALFALNPFGIQDASLVSQTVTSEQRLNSLHMTLIYEPTPWACVPWTPLNGHGDNERLRQRKTRVNVYFGFKFSSSTIFRFRTTES